MKKYFYISGADNTEFWNFFRLLKEEGENVNFRWSGPYAVTTHLNGKGELWEVWDDLDNGVPYSIKRIF